MTSTALLRQAVEESPIVGQTSNSDVRRGEIMRRLSDSFSSRPSTNGGVSTEDVPLNWLRQQTVIPGPLLAPDLPPFEADRPSERGAFRALQEWEGTVLDIGKTDFTARLVDVTRRSNVAEEEAEFPLQDLSEDDRALVRPGAVFRWAIGYHRLPGGTKRRASQIVFRRLPQWTKADLEQASSEAQEISRSISWE